MTKTRILLADDHAVLHAGLRLLIEAQADMVCAGEASDGLETLARAERSARSGAARPFDAPAGRPDHARVRRKAPARILVLTMHADEEYLRQCLKGGAAGYVLKEAADQELLLAIRAVIRGEVYIHPAMTAASWATWLIDPRSDSSWKICQV